MKTRIIGFDLARAYAIFGMFIVNFNTVFGSHTNHSGLSGFLNLFNGNSSTLFVMLAGMGVSLMTNRNDYTADERKSIKSIITKRSWFLFFLGLAFYIWWPADILHFYGGYMHIAVLLIFFPKKYFLYTAAAAIIIFHLLLLAIPYETGWNFETLMYHDFWTLKGFLRNTFYNGWNSIFPWMAFFLVGMYLGRLNWNESKTPKMAMLIGISVYFTTLLIQSYATSMTQNQDILFYLTADYLPPFLPFMLGTSSFGLILISIFILIGNKISNSKIAKVLASTGQMTLTHYIAHLVLGLLILSIITGKTLSYNLVKEIPTNPIIILSFAISYFLFSCTFSYIWTKKYKNGPLEMLMRKISDGKKNSA
jgi:uncharacterized membrane protein YeiB